MKRIPLRRGKKKLSWAKRRTREKNRMIKALDDACRERVRVCRDEEICQKCGKVGGTFHEDGYPVIPQWAHIIRRGASQAIRWLDINSCCLCSKCHFWFDNNKEAGMIWFSVKFPDRFAALQQYMFKSISFGYTEIKELYEQLGAVGSGV